MIEKRLEERIAEKRLELKKYLEEFNRLEIPNFEEYENDFKIKAMSERYFEKIVEVIIQLTLYIIRLKKLESPESEDHAFIILAKNNILSGELAKRLHDAKDMRNIVIHNYSKIENSIVYKAITEEIVKDAEEFLKEVWGYTSFPQTRKVDNHIAKLRQKIEDDPDQPKHIITGHRMGYKFLR
jgi:uncharacterized protein YutE (UPF0331/DUF86 family)